MSFDIPINVDLFIDCRVPQQGGDPNANLTAINNLKFRCVTSRDKTCIFHYDQSNDKELNNSRYLGKGSNTVVMSVIQTNGLQKLNGKQFVMRVTELADKFNIKKYTEDKNLIGRYVPDAYYYGVLYCDAGVKLNYVIAQKCEVFTKNKINQMNHQYKQLFLRDLIECLIILQKNNYVLWDLKIDNIGYINNNDCVLIDYDEKTILHSTYLSNVNTYYPTYYYLNYLSFKNKYELQNFLNIKFDKMSVAGLADVILSLFFTIKNNETVTNSSLYNLHSGGTFKSIHTNNSSNLSTYISSSTSNWWQESFLNLINGEKIKEYLSLLTSHVAWSDYHTNLLNVLFKYDSYTGLLSPEYSKIPTFEEIQTILHRNQVDLGPMEIADPYDMVGGSNIEYKKKYEKYVKLNQMLQNK